MIPRRVGIFWLAGGRLLRDTTPLSRAQECGDCLTHATNHVDHWTHLQQIGVASPDTEYEDFPRGRAVFNTKTERFEIHADRCIVNRQALASKITRIMRLPLAETDLKADDHYRCSQCLRELSAS